MIPINPEEWKEVSKDEFRILMARGTALLPEALEWFDGTTWRLYAKK